MKNAGILTGGVVGGSILGGILGNPFLNNDTESETPQTETASESSFQEARMFFDRYEDFAILQAAVERIYPEDDNGPGAIELGVPFFIDKQLAGSWGTNAKEYMNNPFLVNGDSSNVPRYETPLNRGQIMIEGLRKMDSLSNEQFEDGFTNIEGEQQDEILQQFDSGEVELTGASSSQFFSLLRQLTIEGALSDPLHGGNKNMAGWDMVDYPGPRPAFIDIIEEEEFIKMDPVGLNDYQQT